MLKPEEKKKIKEILSEGLGLNSEINIFFFLNKIIEMDKKIDGLENNISLILRNQKNGKL